MIQQKTSKLNTACWLFTISVILILTVSTLIKHGMFMDAMLYTSVAHNLSHGIGTFWFPYFDEYNIAGLSSFHEQPPLVFGIQSLFFRLLGDSMYVERFYTFFTLCVTAFLIKILWNEITKENGKLKPFAWLAILLWITIPVCFWSYSNNMHENTMGIFTISSVLCSYKALQSKVNPVFYFFLAGLFICLAVLSKGFPGFFPVTLPFLHWLFIRKKTFQKTLVYSAIILSVLLVVACCLYLYHDSNKSLSIYLFKRALKRINEIPSVHHRSFIFWRLLSELIPVFLFTILFFSVAKWKKINTEFSAQKKQVFFFIAVGVCGSLPLMLTMVQNGFYFVPSLPFFGIGFALLTAPVIHSLLTKIKPEYHITFLRSSLFILLATLVFTFLQKDNYSRDKDLLNDVELIASVVPANTRINCPDSLWQDWRLNCYLIRMHHISVNNIKTDSTVREYFVTEINAPNPDSLLYEEMKLGTIQFKLYKKNNTR